jgi:tRNA (uracil-5-)-methyltransferase
MRPWEIQPECYDELFLRKWQGVAERFSAVLSVPEPQAHPSPVDSYRVRAEFRIWHDGDALDYVMFDSEAPRDPVVIRDFPPALAPIRERMGPLREALAAHRELRRKLFQVEFLASRDGDCLITLIYHRPLDEAWELAAGEVAGRLGAQLIGRSRRQKRVLSRDHVVESFTVGGRAYRYRQYEQSFVQPNAPVNERMLNWVWEHSEHACGDLLELYCGNGNFTLPLADRHAHVIATELSKSGTRAAKENLGDNGVGNVAVVRLSAEEVSEAMNGTREFRRLAALPRSLASYELTNVFVDPPRAGLDDATLACVRDFSRIVYISCNPDTLLANLQCLAPTHSVQALAFFDQFPYTPHLESGVVLERR